MTIGNRLPSVPVHDKEKMNYWVVHIAAVFM
jgi:hypothetical protein